MPRAAIIGAGPAGSAAAILLSRAGWDVSIIEQHRFPRDKVCGECLSALGIDVLRRMDLLHRVDPFQPAQLRRAHLHALDGSSVSVELPRAMLGISRAVFDQVLLDAARESGAKVHQPVRCELFGRVANGVRLRNLDTNHCDGLFADWIILSDGKGVGLPSNPLAARDFGIKAHFSNVSGPDDAIELFGANGCYGGLARIENDRWNAAFAVPRNRIRQVNGNLNELFAQISMENATLSRRMMRARQIREWLCAPLLRFAVARDWDKRIIPVGNAAAAIEPIGGEGMGLAMRSAELAAQTLIESAKRGVEPNLWELRARYRRLWRRRSIGCRAAALAFSSPALSNRALWALDGCESLTSLVMRWMGK